MWWQGWSRLLLVLWLARAHVAKPDEGLEQTAIAVTATANSNDSQEKRIKDNELLELQLRLEQLEEMAFVRDRPEAQEDTGEQSLLEIFSDASRQWILQNFAPYTDPQCTFSLKRVQCEPRCECRMDFKLGDYSLGRACRLVDSSPAGGASEENEECDPNAPELTGWQRLKTAALRAKQSAGRGIKSVLHGAKHGLASGASETSRLVVRSCRTVYRHMETHAPPTDEECSFLFDGLYCEPQDLCTFRPRIGDFHPGRSCRLRAEEAGYQLPAPEPFVGEVGSGDTTHPWTADQTE